MYESALFPLLAAWIVLGLVGLNALWSGLGVLLERSAFGRGHQVWQIGLRPGQVRKEIAANLRFDAVVGVFTAGLVATGAIRLAGPDAGGAGPAPFSGWVTFGACWVGFEVYYWFLHRAMHTRPLYRFHRHHHESRVTTPFTGVSTSAVEALGWAVGFGLAPVLLSLHAPVSGVGFALYFVYNYSGNIVGHVNTELFPRTMHGRLQSWLLHPIVYHALHHARFVNHYGFGSTFMDRLLGTEWEDWPALHEQVAAGHPLTSLTQRGA